MGNDDRSSRVRLNSNQMGLQKYASEFIRWFWVYQITHHVTDCRGPVFRKVKSAYNYIAGPTFQGVIVCTGGVRGECAHLQASAIISTGSLDVNSDAAPIGTHATKASQKPA